MIVENSMFKSKKYIILMFVILIAIFLFVFVIWWFKPSKVQARREEKYSSILENLSQNTKEIVIKKNRGINSKTDKHEYDFHKTIRNRDTINEIIKYLKNANINTRVEMASAPLYIIFFNGVEAEELARYDFQYFSSSKFKCFIDENSSSKLMAIIEGKGIKEELNYIHEYITKNFAGKNGNKAGYVAHFIDEEQGVVVVQLRDISEKYIEIFKSSVIDSDFIKFEKGEPAYAT